VVGLADNVADVVAIGGDDVAVHEVACYSCFTRNDGRLVVAFAILEDERFDGDRNAAPLACTSRPPHARIPICHLLALIPKDSPDQPVLVGLNSRLTKLVQQCCTRSSNGGAVFGIRLTNHGARVLHVPRPVRAHF
jgi:hypothetical protein